jgi:hypothetical protein
VKITADGYVIAQYQLIFNLNRYLIDFKKCSGRLSPPIGRPVAKKDASKTLALVAGEKNVAVVRMRFLRCARHSVFFSKFFMFKNQLRLMNFVEYKYFIFDQNEYLENKNDI